MNDKITPFIKKVKNEARKDPKVIVLPEGFEERIIKAAAKIVKEKTAIPILIGDPKEIEENAKKFRVKLDTSKIQIIDPKNTDKLEKYAENLYQKRKEKGMTKEDAVELLKTKVNYFGTMMVETGDADGMISGTTWSTADTIRPALQIIKTKEKFHKVSGLFFMVFEKRLLLFADAAVMIDPNSHELADITIDTAETAKKFGIEPRIAMLSFSTHGSAKHPDVDKVVEATKIVNHKRPDLVCEGEMQVDAALVPEVCERKFPGSKLKGDANILIFPNLSAANISYKLVERLAKAKAIGPILQGLKKPVNDLSRGCRYQDIVTLAAFTTLEAQGIKKPLL